MEAVGRAGRPHLTLPDCENAEQEQGGHGPLRPGPACSELETRTRSAVPAPVASGPWGVGGGAGVLQGPGGVAWLRGHGLLSAVAGRVSAGVAALPKQVLPRTEHPSAAFLFSR